MRWFVPNPSFAAEMNQEDETREGYRAVAETVKGYAEPMVREAHGPWMPREGQSEVVATGEDDDGVYVALTEHGGAIMEYGGAYSPVYAPLRRAARAAGLDVDETDL